MDPDVRIVAEVGVVGITLMGIGIDEKDLVRLPVDCLKVLDCNGHIVEYAEAQAPSRKCVMSPASQIGGYAVLKRSHRSRNRP